MSRFDYFANNAPPVPDWFKPELPMPPRQFGNLMEKFGERASEYFSFTSGRRRPVPEHLKDVHEYWEARVQEGREHALIREQMTYFAWRRFYAQKMVENIPEDL